MPSPVGGLGLAPEKNQFCAKNYAILSKFWYFFPILQQKVGDYPPVLKVGDLSPCPLLRRLGLYVYAVKLEIEIDAERKYLSH